MAKKDMRGVKKSSSVQHRKNKGLPEVNVDYLKDLAGGNTDFMNEITLLFINEAPTLSKNLQLGIKHNDYALLKLTAHKLKSSVLIYAREDMAELTVIIGEKVNAEEYNELPKITRKLIKQLDALAKALGAAMPFE